METNRKKYVVSKLDVILFDEDDVITASNPDETLDGLITDGDWPLLGK